MGFKLERAVRGELRRWKVSGDAASPIDVGPAFSLCRSLSPPTCTSCSDCSIHPIGYSELLRPLHQKNNHLQQARRRRDLAIASRATREYGQALEKSTLTSSTMSRATFAIQPVNRFGGSNTRIRRPRVSESHNVARKHHGD